jgi:hypothetical protein
MVAFVKDRVVRPLSPVASKPIAFFSPVLGGPTNASNWFQGKPE